MKTLFAACVLFASLGACRDVIGIQTIVYDDSGVDGAADSAPVGDGGCLAPTVVFSSTSVYDTLSVQDGFLYAEITSSGVDRCPTSGCVAPSSVLVAGSLVSFINSVIAPATIDYTLQGTDTDSGAGGQVRTIGLDGTNDALAFDTATQFPANIAASGTRIFWADDPYSYGGNGTDSVNCIGCNGATSSPWMTKFPDGVYGIVADGSDVYALIDDTNFTTLDVVACSITTACGATPRSVITGIDSSTIQTQIASDGTNFYIARENHADVVRVDQTGTSSEVLTTQDVLAIAVDATGGNLYYGTSTGVIGRVKSDGSAPPTPLACNQDTITAIAVDDQNVYFLAGSTTSYVYKLPK